MPRAPIDSIRELHVRDFDRFYMYFIKQRKNDRKEIWRLLWDLSLCTVLFVGVPGSRFGVRVEFCLPVISDGKMRLPEPTRPHCFSQRILSRLITSRVRVCVPVSLPHQKDLVSSHHAKGFGLPICPLR
ncbi:hypothetical protein PO909_027889 [Leuciscus waleckii]